MNVDNPVDFPILVHWSLPHHWPTSVPYSLNSTTGHASLYMQPLGCNDDVCNCVYILQALSQK